MNTIINLFCIPCITLYIHYKRKRVEPRLSAKFVLEYGISATVICLIAQIIYRGYCYLVDESFGYQAIKYSLIATVVAVILPFVYEFIKKYISIHVEITKNEPEKENGEKGNKKTGEEE